MPHGDEVQFSVRDTGPGMAPDVLPQLFNPFWQAGKERRKGAGLGLYIARGIALAHGSELEVSSTLGKGSRFQFALPRVGDRAQDVPAAH